MVDLDAGKPVKRGGPIAMQGGTLLDGRRSRVIDPPAIRSASNIRRCDPFSANRFSTSTR